MPHTKLRLNRSIGSTDDFKGFNHMWAWRSSLSCDLDNVYKLWIPRPKDALHEKVQVGKDQEKAQSEKDSHSKNRGGKKPN